MHRVPCADVTRHSRGYARPARPVGALEHPLQVPRDMLKLLGSYVLAKLLGFGIIGAIVIYLLLSLVS
jgi:hypothetical protein